MELTNCNTFTRTAVYRVLILYNRSFVHQVSPQSVKTYNGTKRS
jgi:hypothetical protein